MTLKNRLIFAAGCVVAAPAFALTPPPAGPTPFETLFISGSSAATPILEAAQEDLCAAGTNDEFRGVAAVPGTLADYNAADLNYTAYYCTYKSAAPVPAALQGKNILVKKRSAGGSIFGVNPVATATAVANMVVTSTACSNVAAGKWNCLETAASLVNEVPQAGISDVEPALLQIPANNPGTFPALTSAQIAADLTTQFPFAQAFGIAVSSDVIAAGTTNLTKTQISALLTGNYGDWGEVNPTLAGTAVRVCYRSAGSGTRASAGAFFLDIGCKPSGAQALSGAAILNGSTGTVRSCLNTAGSIGILGVADGPNAPPNTTDTWSFVSIDGYAPTQANFGKGDYQDFVESAMTIRKIAPLPTANQSAIFTTLRGELGNFNIVKTLATVTGNTHLTDAVLAIDPTTLAGVAPTASGTGYTFNAAFPIAWGSKSNNTCQQPAVAYP